MWHIVIDTNVLVSGLRSRRGASFRLLQQVGTGAFEISVSVPLVLEYEEILLREIAQLPLSQDDVGEILDYLCAVARQQQVFFLWRPRVADPGDDMVLELAVAAGCDAIVTFNLRDFADARDFGIEIMNPRDFLAELGDAS